MKKISIDRRSAPGIIWITVTSKSFSKYSPAVGTVMRSMRKAGYSFAMSVGSFLFNDENGLFKVLLAFRKQS